MGLHLCDLCYAFTKKKKKNLNTLNTYIKNKFVGDHHAWQNFSFQLAVFGMLLGGEFLSSAQAYCLDCKGRGVVEEQNNCVDIWAPEWAYLSDQLMKWISPVTDVYR